MRKIKIPTAYIILIILGVLFVVFLGKRARAKYTKDLIANSISGKVSSYEPAGKGIINVWLNHDSLEYSLSGFAKYADTLAIGDSLFKKAKSRDIYYFKLKGDKYYLFDIFKIN